MPPFKKAVNIDEVIETKKVQVESLKHQCYAIESMLAINSDQQFRINAEKESIARDTALKSLETEEVDAALESNVKFMANLSKTSEEHLKNRYASLLKAMADVEKDNEELQKKLSALVAKKEADLQRWDNEVSGMEKQIEEKALNFGVRLKETLMKANIR